MTLVTVIIPAYNASETLERTLLSVLHQTHKQLEVYVVDDGSTDATFDIADRLAKADPRIQILRQTNSGVAVARNNALRRAAGEYTSWLDADDIWHPTKIEKQLAVFRHAKTPLTFVYSGYRLIDPDDRIVPNFRPLADVSGNTLSRQIATNHFSNVSSIMVPTRLAKKLGGHSPKLREWGIEGAEDLLLQLQLASVGPTGCCPEALVGYRMHCNNMSLSFLRAMQSNLKALEIIEQSQTGVPPWVFRLGRARTAGYVLHILKKGDVGGALKGLSLVWQIQPLYVLLTFFLILSWQVRTKLNLGPIRDPEIGRSFGEADPTTAVWYGHMLLTPRHRRQLEEIDSRHAPAKTQDHGSWCMSV